MNRALSSGVAIVVGAVLASLLIFIGTQVLSPAAKQSNAPLISYGETS